MKTVTPLENTAFKPATAPHHLTRCPDCAHHVSTMATSCPGCGRPLAAQVIEATSKQWKAGQLFGWLIVFFGLVCMCFASIDNSFMGLGLFVIACGVIVGFVSRVAAWWENG
ncbi:MAG: hypothetical protein OEN49_11295 [Gammaproteobacteria bacterium]|nr:hypothetical protein [Gammaproteobacteria bacterium]